MNTAPLTTQWTSTRVFIGMSNTREVLYLDLSPEDINRPVFRLLVFVDTNHQLEAPVSTRENLEVIVCDIQDDIVLQAYFAPQEYALPKGRFVLFCAERLVLHFNSFSDFEREFNSCDVSKAERVRDNLREYPLNPEPSTKCHYVISDTEVRICSRGKGREGVTIIPWTTSIPELKAMLDAYKSSKNPYKDILEYLKHQKVIDFPLNQIYAVDSVSDGALYRIRHKLNPYEGVVFTRYELADFVEAMKRYAVDHLKKSILSI